MFFQEVTPDTSVYMIAGYTVFTIVTAIYLLSLFIRSRNLQRDLALLESLKKESQAPAGQVQAKAVKPGSPKATAARRKTTAKSRRKT